MAVIFLLSAQSSLPSVSNPAVQEIINNLGHFAEYMVLAVLLLRALADGHVAGRTIAISLLVAVLYAISDEFHQSFVPNRMPSFSDAFVDTLGALVGVTGWIIYQRRRSSTNARP